MSIDHSDDIAYGLPVRMPESMEWWDFTEAEAPEGEVIPFWSESHANHDRKGALLVIGETFEHPEPGTPRFFGPYVASVEPYLTWDALLVAAAERLKVEVTGQPGYFFMSSEG